jgi:hypothetical protein
MLALLAEIFEVCIIPLLGVLTAFLVKWLNFKSQEIQSKTENDKFDKYIQMLNETIVDCVIATNQTYVNSLKESGSFDEAAQKVAFNKTFDAVMTILSADARECLNAAVGDLNAYISEKIEAQVNINR